jgi:hypothetical protein
MMRRKKEQQLEPKKRRWRKKGVNGIHANWLSIENICAP